MRNEVLRAMTEIAGPYLTLCVDVRERTEDRDKVIDLRWAALLDEARAAGASDELIEAVDEVIAEHARSGTIESLLLVAADEEVVLVRPLGGEVHFSGFGPVPQLRTALGVMQEQISCVVAVVDRRRAEIRVPVPDEAREEVETVEGQTNLPLRKVQAGGWSQQRFQARADKAWLENAKTMAPAIVEVADAVEADLIILAGDVRERSLVRDEIEGLTQRKVIVVEEGSLAPGSDDEPLDERVTELIEQERRLKMHELNERLGAALSQAEPMALDSIAACVHAAQKSQIEALLVDPTAEAEPTVWVNREGTVVGMRAEDVEALGGQEPREASAVDALIHAAVMNGSDVIVVGEPIELPQGVAALLRFSDESTAYAATHAVER